MERCRKWGARGGSTAQEFQFGDFRLDPSQYRLQKGGRTLRVEKLPMELLILLVQRRGELISREEIAERLWGKDVFLDVEHSINTAVRKIRVVLRDDPEKPRFVETVVGKGYRFAAPVTSKVNGQEHREVMAHEEPAPVPAATPTRHAGKSQVWLGILAGLAVLGALAIGIAATYRRGSRSSPAQSIHSLVVLPLKNLSGDAGQDYFADGMTEELIGRMAAIPGLRVVSRTSAMQFKDTHLSVPEIARQLHVDAVLEGSVVKEGDRVRVNAQLIRGATDEHLWAQEYDRQEQSIVTLQEDVARTIAREINITLTPQQQARLSKTTLIDPAVHESYLKGRYYLNQRTQEALDKSIGYFQEAVAKDPSYAMAYCGLADAYALLGFRGDVPQRDSLALGKAAALKAIGLDPTLADPHESLAFILETHEWNWALAQQEYKRALELNPGDARAHHWYAGYLTYVGRVDEGIEEEKLARDLDPLSLPINNALAGRFLVARRYDEAQQYLREVMQMDPRYAAAHQTMGWLYLNTGKKDEAIREFEEAVRLSSDKDLDFELDLGFAYAAAGRRQQAKAILDKLKLRYKARAVPAGSIAILYGALGEVDEAFVWLEKAYDERDPELTYVNVPGRRFEPLRHDPRFQDLVRRVGLAN